MKDFGFWILAIPGIILLVGVYVLLFIMRKHNVADDLSGEPPVSSPKRKADHPVPHDATEEDASDPWAAALIQQNPSSITGLW